MLVPMRTRPRFCNYPFVVVFVLLLVFFVIGPRNLTLLKGRRSKPQLVTFQGALLLLCGGTTQTRRDDRDPVSDLNAWKVTTSRDRDLENAEDTACTHLV